jgi:dUTPase
MAVRTKNGRAVTDAELDRMADEAEAGYDLSTWKRRPGRPSLSPNNTSAHSPRITTRVPEELRARVASRASAEGKSVSDVMRHLLEGYAGQSPAASKADHRR